MVKDQLFELIRKEEVVIWAGAGMSLYAGYPTGKVLKDQLYNALTKEEQASVNIDLDLPAMAEEIFMIKEGNKNFLLSTLKSIYKAKPKSTVWHDKIASIPHFKAIITTNYDQLFEGAYGENGNVIVEPKNIPYLSKNDIPIYKVHGDFQIPDSIILTKSDYINFFKNSLEFNSIWTSVKNLFNNYHILFLGYSLEDPNVSVIYDKFIDELADHKKNAFFVAPNLPKHRMNHLARKGITYIKSKGEDLIDEIIINIKDNINDDYSKEKVSPGTYFKFFKQYGGELIIKENKLISLMGLSKNFKGNFTLDPKSNSINGINDIISGKSIGDVEISGKDIIKGDFRFSGIKLLDFDENIILKLRSSPIKKSRFDIRFEDGFEINEIPVEIYRTSSSIILKVFLRSAQFTIDFSILSLEDATKGFSYNLTFNHEPHCNRVSDEKELFTLLYNFGSSKNFTVFYEGGDFNHSQCETPIVKEDAQNNLKYFDKLYAIEQYYNVRFRNFNYSDIKNEFQKVNKAYKISKGEMIINSAGEGSLSINNDFKERLPLFINFKPSFTVTYSPENIEVHGQILNLGYKTVVIEGVEIIDDLNSIILREETELKIKFEKMITKYSKAPID